MTITIPSGAQHLARAATHEFNPNIVFTEIIHAATEWKRIAAEEQTKQRKVRAQERVLIQDIRARRDALLAYLDHSFDERHQTFGRLFQTLDTAIAQGADDIGPILESITTLASHGPFAGLRDAEGFAAFFADPETTIEV